MDQMTDTPARDALMGMTHEDLVQRIIELHGQLAETRAKADIYLKSFSHADTEFKSLKSRHAALLSLIGAAVELDKAKEDEL